MCRMRACFDPRAPSPCTRFAITADASRRRALTSSAAAPRRMRVLPPQLPGASALLLLLPLIAFGCCPCNSACCIGFSRALRPPCVARCLRAAKKLPS
eukprot:366235-Chlamydomonas_euryale.AAC.7